MPCGKDIVVVGGGGHSKVVIAILRRLGQFNIVGYTDPHDRGTILGTPYLGTDSNLIGDVRERGARYAALGLGLLYDTAPRRALAAQLVQAGYGLPAIIAASAVVSDDAEIDDATVVCEGSVIQPGTSIGFACIINTSASIDHDCLLKDHVHIAPGATLSGGVTVEADCFIGVGASVIHGVRIASRCVIGAGATVTKDLLVAGTYVGTPARLAKAAR